MKRKYEETISDTLIGFEIFENKIRKLLARREDLKFDWRNDLEKLLIDAEQELFKVENK